jgi:predicted phosphodiesterase
LGSLVAQAVAARADVYAFGSLFDDSGGGRGPNPFNIDPVQGVHDIHMNQGNPRDNHFQDNGTFQDGALFVHFAGDRERWVAVFIAFQSQSFSTDDSGAPTAAPEPPLIATRLVPAQRRPSLLTGPVAFQAALDPARRAHVLSNLQKIPSPRIDPPVFALKDVIGDEAAQEITASGQIVIHTVGDTGRGTHSAQSAVAEAMARDYQKPNPADHPALFFHLGDVIYGHDKDALYREMFYSPYDVYPGQIVAIPGNHDGEVIPRTDPQSLAAFLANFCDAKRQHPPIAGTAPRLTMNQPGVYFRLDAPFVRLIGLYSNVAENSGFISIPGAGGDAQKNFLVSQLKAIAELRAHGDTAALVIAMHHPPYSGGGHAGSAEMLADIDDAVKQAGLAPDIVLSGHAHNYQRFTRKFFLDGVALEIPYVVAGGGGRGITPVRVQSTGGPIAGLSGDHSLRQFYNGFGYMALTITGKVLTAEFFGVSGQDTIPLDSIALDLRTHKITQEQPTFTHPAPGEAGGHQQFGDE